MRNPPGNEVVPFEYQAPTAVEIAGMTEHVRSFITGLLGVDPTETEQMRTTPERVVKAWLERTQGYRESAEDILKSDFPGEGYDEVVVLRDIEFMSSCEHHLLPFYGVAHVAYIPSDRVVGISKLARLVDCYARRLQIQERLGLQVADALEAYLRPLGVAVIVESKHMCMTCRGVRKQSAVMVTSVMRGAFKNPKSPMQLGARAEVLALMGK